MWTFKQHCPVVLQSSLTATGIDMEVEVVTDYILSCKSMIIVNRGWGCTQKVFSMGLFLKRVRAYSKQESALTCWGYF